MRSDQQIDDDGAKQLARARRDGVVLQFHGDYCADAVLGKPFTREQLLTAVIAVTNYR